MRSAILPRLAVACPLLFAVLRAGELKVDINRDGKNSASTTATGYVQWTAAASGGTASTGTAAITQSFPVAATGETVTVSLSMTAAAQAAGGTGLTYTYYATGTTTEGQKLVSDGVTVAPAVANTGGQLQMTVTGLAAGEHSLLAFHNAGDAAASLGTMAPVKVYLNGQYLSTFTPSIRATDLAAPTTYATFATSSTADVTTLLFVADASSSATTRNVVLNGFEIDTPNSSRIANTPSPIDGDEHVDADGGYVVLSWGSALAGTAASHDVYLGASLSAVKAATHASALFLGNQTANSRQVSVTDPYATYYWRVDEVDALGNATAGTVWSFRPRHLAFPGAEGYGRFARGGRGGRVVHVTSLADYSGSETPIPGTLRYAVIEETGPRVIVFDVGGMIELKARLTLTSPYVTVAGQTAPGKGVCLKGWGLGLSGASDAIVRHIRARPGRTLQTITVDTYKNGTTGTPITATAAVAKDGMGMQGSNHSIFDHCSISWTIDESFSSRSAKNITLQRTLISEALNKALHPNYIFLDDLAGTEHGYAASVGGDIASFHHNLLAHCYGRNWSMAGGLDASAAFAGRLDFTNNVVYNWGSRTTDGGAMEVDFVNNYYKPGPGTTLVPYALTMNHENNQAGSQRAYFAGNVMQGYFNEANQTAGRRSVVSNGVPTPTYETFVTTPFFSSHVSTDTALAAYKRVLSDVGANLPLDDHDKRIIAETLAGTYTYAGSVTGKKGFPDVETDVGGWEDYPTVSRPAGFDTDGDGLPDWWETLHGTNPDSPAGDFSDANADPETDGYTRLCDYLAWLAFPRVETASGAPVDLDLSKLTAGFTASPIRQVYLALADASAGSAQLLSDGKTLRFTPAPGFSGIARVLHTVADSAGDSMEGTVGVRVIAASASSPSASLAIVSISGDGLALDFTGETGLTYTLQHSADLSNWTSWRTVEGTGAPERIAVPPELSPTPRRFFRAVR